MSESRPSFWRVTWAALTTPGWALRGLLSLKAENRSLRASLDDAHREISRLTGEKHARDTAMRRAVEELERPYRQGEHP